MNADKQIFYRRWSVFVRGHPPSGLLQQPAARGFRQAPCQCGAAV